MQKDFLDIRISHSSTWSFEYIFECEKTRCQWRVESGEWEGTLMDIAINDADIDERDNAM